MTTLRSFIDSGLLILAACGTDNLSQQAMTVLDDPNRHHVTSDFVRLEVLPKAVYNHKTDEAQFYQEFFNRAETTVESSSTLVAEALSEAQLAGLSAVDALHVAAAKHAHCNELITSEKPTKPLFRVRGLAVATIRPSS